MIFDATHKRFWQNDMACFIWRVWLTWISKLLHIIFQFLFGSSPYLILVLFNVSVFINRNQFVQTIIYIYTLKLVCSTHYTWADLLLLWAMHPEIFVESISSHDEWHWRIVWCWLYTGSTFSRLIFCWSPLKF